MLSLKDNIISALDDHAEYVLGSDFSGKISQKEAVEFIVEKLKEKIIEEEVTLYKVFRDNLEIQKGIKFLADRLLREITLPPNNKEQL